MHPSQAGRVQRRAPFGPLRLVRFGCLLILFLALSAQQAPVTQTAVAASLRSLTGTSAIVQETEPYNNSNDTAATAQSLSGTNLRLKGTIFPINDIDFFSFNATAGDRVYTAIMTGTSSGGADSQLSLIASDGTTVIEADNDDGSFSAASSSIAGATIPSTGTYYLKVNTQTVNQSIRPYYLYLNVQSGTPTAETEPNDTLPGQALPASGWVDGSRSSATDVDYYAIALNAGDSVYLSLDLDPERDTIEWNGRLGLGTFGTPPNILVVDDAGTTTPDSEAFFFTVKDAGTYGVYVASGGVAFGTYHLSVSVFPAESTAGCTTYTSTDFPVTIPTGPGIVTSALIVPGNPRIGKMSVAIQLTHTFMADLDVQLTSPTGNTVGLFSDIGSATTGGTQTTMDMVLDDQAGAIPSSFTITQGMINKPEPNYRLAWFNGQDAGGTWTLTIRDDAALDGGTLNGWSITICDPAPVHPAGSTITTLYSTDFEAGDAGFTHSGTLDEWARGTPGSVPIISCNSGANCFKTDLAGTYEAGSNQTLLSPNINLAGQTGKVVLSWAQKFQLDNATFDTFSVRVSEVGNPANSRIVYQFLDADMAETVGNPGVVSQESAGWGIYNADITDFIGKNIEVQFNLSSNATIQRAGLAIDDVSVTTSGFPEIAVEQPAGTDLTDGTASVPFGNVVVGANSSLSFTIKNTGTANLTGLGITIDGTDASQFSVTASPAAPVGGPNGSTTFTVQFAPTSVGAKTAALHIASNDADENPFDVALTGTGTAPEIAVEQPAGTDLTDGTASVPFSSISIGSNTSLSFTIKNTGTADLTGLGITIDGADASQFSVTASPAAPVSGPNGSTTFTVQFAPTSVGAKTAALHIASNDADENPFDIALTGTGLASNAAPTLDPITDPAAINEDAAAQTVNLTGIDAGAVNENGQILTVSAVSNNAALIPNPTVTYTSANKTGSLSYTPVANANGSAIITVTVTDNGGTANGSIDTVTQAFTINVLPVNDAPDFTPGANQSVLATAGPQTVAAWASNFIPGPADEVAQALLGYQVVSNSNPALFATGPAIDINGTLTYTPLGGASGIATISMVVRDNGGTANSGVDTSSVRTFTISISQSYRAYLPLVQQRSTPDLVINAITLNPAKTSFTAGEPAEVLLTVTNRGNAPAGSFWVDLYINPTNPPTAANQLWNQRCSLQPCFGMAWFIQGGLAPGQSITLSSRNLPAGYSIWPGGFANGTTDLYAYADSWNPGVVDGALAESNESNNLAELHGLTVTGTNPFIVTQSLDMLLPRPNINR